ncbi:MAG: hypothetical protein IPM42_01075 [Saprospiraceae bacterium]|nr:hypothetical protein [Saprospiraceae bacterium]
MKSLKLIPFLSILLFTLSANISFAQTTTNSATKSGIEVIQFHSEHRCVTCLKIEGLTKEVVKSYPGMTFKLVNVDDTKNEKMAEKFEAAGTAVFIYNPKTGKKKDMTDFAFMNSSNKTKFMEGMKKEIKQFGN